MGYLNYCFYFIVSLFTFTLISFLILCKLINGYWSRRGVDTTKPMLFFGNAIDVILQRKSLGESLREYYFTLKKNGNRFGGYYFLMRPVFVVTDLDLIKDMFNKDFEHFADHPAHVNEKDDPLSAHMFALKGERWKTVRGKLSPAFSPGKLKLLLETVLKCCNDLQAAMDEKLEKHDVVVDMREMSDKFSIDVMGSLVFGLECNSFKNSQTEFHTYTARFLHNESIKGSLLVLLSFIFPEFFKWVNVSIHDREMTDFFLNVVKNVVKYREENNIIRKDFMHLLLQLKNIGEICEEDVVGSIRTASSTTGNGKSWTMRELAAQCFIFLAAGFETTSIAPTLCILELSINTKLQDKAREEINRVLRSTNGIITYEAVNEMEYLNKCVCETLRKYPSVLVQSRVCTKKYTVPGSDVVLNEGTPILIPVYGVQSDPDYYPNPEVFDPERFSEEHKARRHPCAWIPFSSGPRQCIAYRFGLLQIKVELITLLRRYKFSLNSSTKFPVSFDPTAYTLSNSSNILLNVEKV